MKKLSAISHQPSAKEARRRSPLFSLRGDFVGAVDDEHIHRHVLGLHQLETELLLDSDAASKVIFGLVVWAPRGRAAGKTPRTRPIRNPTFIRLNPQTYYRDKHEATPTPWKLKADR